MIHAAKLLLLLPFAPVAMGQAVAAARGPAIYTGFRLPDVSGSLRYSLSASQSIPIGSDAGSSFGDSTNISGNIGYVSPSPTQPFSVVYSGAYLHTDSGNTPSQVAQTLSLSQVLMREQWQFVIADSVSYLPQSASGGLSGIPGLGDTNVPPVTQESQDILTNYAQRINNTLSGTVERRLTGKTSLSGTGSQSILRYINAPNGSTTDDNSYSGSASLSHEFDVRTSASLQYSYSVFKYLAVDYGTTSQMIGIQLQRKLSRRAQFSGLIGPSYTTSSNSTVIPARTTATGNANLSYVTDQLATSLGFDRTTGSGTGLTTGVTSTSAHLSASRQLGGVYHASVSTSYSNSSSLQTGAFNTKSVTFSGQVNRGLTRSLSAYASYSAQHQLNSGTSVPTLALNGLIQSMSFGVTFAPEGFHFGH